MIATWLGQLGFRRSEWRRTALAYRIGCLVSAAIAHFRVRVQAGLTQLANRCF
jgi:hypothetical protein